MIFIIFYNLENIPYGKQKPNKIIKVYCKIKLFTSQVFSTILICNILLVLDIKDAKIGI